MTTDHDGTIRSMTASEWLDIAATIRERWPAAKIPVDTIKRWGEDLADLPGAQVSTAVDVLYREGREYPPHGGQIRAKVAELALGAPEFGEVVAILRRIVDVPEYGAVEIDGRWQRVTPRADALAAEHSSIGDFVDAVGWDQIDGLEGGQDEARMRHKWEAFIRRAVRDESLRGLPDAGLTELRRIGGKPVHGELRRGAGIAAVRGELERGAA